VNRRAFLVGSGAALVALAAAACSGDDDDETPANLTITTLPGPGAGSEDAVLLRTGASLSLSAAAKHPAAAAAHEAHAALLDPSVTVTHPEADATWATAADAELALAATFQAWAAVLTTPELRQRVMSCGASCARLYAVALSSPPSLPEAFQLVDPAVPDAWLLR
jgi:hypothetical protein